jgi:hypothetical protein
VFEELARLHMMPLDWDIDPRDWALPGVGAIESAMLDAGPGDIILCHDLCRVNESGCCCSMRSKTRSCAICRTNSDPSCRNVARALVPMPSAARRGPELEWAETDKIIRARRGQPTARPQSVLVELPPLMFGRREAADVQIAVSPEDPRDDAAHVIRDVGTTRGYATYQPIGATAGT